MMLAFTERTEKSVMGGGSIKSLFWHCRRGGAIYMNTSISYVHRANEVHAPCSKCTEAGRERIMEDMEAKCIVLMKYMRGVVNQEGRKREGR